MAEIRACATMEAAVAVCTELLGDQLWQALRHKPGRVGLLLSGGRTPAKVLPSLLARPDLEWDRIDLAASDERLVARDDPASTEGMIQALFAEAGLPCRYHGFGSDLTPKAALDTWSDALGQMAWPPAAAFLGLGDDGHTMSLFPGRIESGDADLFATAVPETPPHAAPRLTLGPAALRDVEKIALIANSAEKQARVAQGCSPDADPQALPVTWLCRLEQTIILCPVA